ncbi:putative basic leucine zipper 9-like [Cocos nucifera]|uniref:Putative basic leucine zipper 9-like n=1 Tax=Cocos nucifera TaxID=13894 RepID=A0A8K0N0D0_COCNU|nr:putative basic leucine zipper 9-like [Cocos nucifera]
MVRLHNQQTENSPSVNLCKEKGKEIMVEKMTCQQQLEENLHMKRLQLSDLSRKASELKRRNILLRMEMLDRKKLQLGKRLSCNSFDGKQKESTRPDEDNRTKDTQEMHHLNPKRLRRMQNKRIYSQRYRLKLELKKLDLEDMHKRLLENMKALPNMILHYDDRKARLKNENDELKRKIANLTEKYYKKAGKHDEPIRSLASTLSLCLTTVLMFFLVAQVEIRTQELRELRELYNVQKESLMRQGKQQAQQFQQTQLMPPQPLEPFPYNYFFLSNIFS